MGLLRSRSRSQRRLKMSVNDCPDDIFWIKEYFVTKFGMVMQHYEPECHAESFVVVFASSRSRPQRGLIWSKCDSFYYIFRTVNSLATKLCLMIHHHKPECPVKKSWITNSGSRSQWMVKISMFVRMISSKPPSILFPNLVLWCIMRKSSYDQNMTMSAVSYELLVLLLPNLVW